MKLALRRLQILLTTTIVENTTYHYRIFAKNDDGVLALGLMSGL